MKCLCSKRECLKFKPRSNSTCRPLSGLLLQSRGRFDLPASAASLFILHSDELRAPHRPIHPYRKLLLFSPLFYFIFAKRKLWLSSSSFRHLSLLVICSSGERHKKIFLFAFYCSSFGQCLLSAGWFRSRLTDGEHVYVNV